MLMLKVKILGKVKPIKAETLVDSGADEVYIHTKKARKIARQDKWGTKTRPVQMPDGRTIRTRGLISLTYKVGGYVGTIEAHILDMDFEMVFGLKWFRTVNPQIDWIRNLIKITKDSKGRQHEFLLRCANAPHDIKPNEKQGEEYTIASFSSIRRALKKKGEGYLWIARTTKQKDTAGQVKRATKKAGLLAKIRLRRRDKKNLRDPKEVKPEKPPEKLLDGEAEMLSKLVPGAWENLSRMIKDNLDQFSQELPSIPPARQYDHKIETGSAKPINLPAFRLTTP